LDWLGQIHFFLTSRTGIRTLLSKPSLLLADEMGLGKAIQAIAALRCLFRRSDSPDSSDPGGARLLLSFAPTPWRSGSQLFWRRSGNWLLTWWMVFHFEMLAGWL
jgi:hypothetical protein